MPVIRNHPTTEPRENTPSEPSLPTWSLTSSALFLSFCFLVVSLIAPDAIISAAQDTATFVLANQVLVLAALSPAALVLIETVAWPRLAGAPRN